MSATLYQTELASIISESKRKHHDLRTLAEKALQDLKAITITSEQQLAADLANKPAFVEPFLRACNTKAAKLAASGVNGLQRLVISQGLPKSRLDQALQAFNACTDLGLDVQLKVLQALPSLVQNYADELQGDLLSSALQVCASLQGAKVSTVSAVAAATLQQLVTAVFARLSEEDSHASKIEPVAEVPSEDGAIRLRPAAYDAYRVFQDLVLVAEGRPAKFVPLTTLSKEECFELLESSIEAKPRLIAEHVELADLIRSKIIPLLTAAVSEQLSFPVTVRCVRILRLLCVRHFPQFAEDLDAVLGLLPHAIEPDTILWKRVLLMEVLRDMFNENGLIVMAYMAYDQENKSVVQDVMAAFVRLSSEKPAIIGLGQQSTNPSGPTRDREDSNGDAKTGVAGVLSSLGVTESSIQGISSQWSVPRSVCYEQLDKTDAPVLPETYIYSLVLECLHGLSETLAKVVLPLTVHSKADAEHSDLPVNPLELEDSPAVLRAKAVASLIESCWPAVLATCSTFLNAALDDSFYRSLIKSYQRFTQVAGLLRLSTPRDALMTTLGKSAVPPQVLNAAAIPPSESVRSPVSESPRIFSNPMNLLSIESLVGQSAASTACEKESRSSLDAVKPVLTVRNLLCLRALLNLAIALGPTLGSAFAVVVEVLKQADIVLSSSSSQQLTRTLSPTQSDPPALVQSFSTEVSAVETAASRLLESTADYPDAAFVVVLDAFCRILKAKPPSSPIATIPETPDTPKTPLPRQRTFSGLPGFNTFAELQTRNHQFVLPKLATLAALNVHRFVSTSPMESGWQRLTEDVLTVAISSSSPSQARRSATDLLCKLSAECISAVSQQDEKTRTTLQLRCFDLMLDIVRGVYEDRSETTSLDIEVQGFVILAVRAILDRSGDTIVAGWDKLIAIISSAFASKSGLAIVDEGSATVIDWSKVSTQFISPRVGKDAFGTVQLICAEFFTLLPLESAPDIIELTWRFMCQTQDLNLALTGITISWNVSDMLFDARERTDSKLAAVKDVSKLESTIKQQAKSSRTAQWVLMLIKLRQIVQADQFEPAKAAFQTICSISKANGSHVNVDVWSFVLSKILIGVLADQTELDYDPEDELCPILLIGTADVFAQQVALFSQLSDIDKIWSGYTEVLGELLNRPQPTAVTAVWQGLTAITSSIETLDSVWRTAVDQIAQLWSDRHPLQAGLAYDKQDNQPVFRAYTACVAQLLRLKGTNLDKTLTGSTIKNLALCIGASDASYYGADVSTLTALQKEVLEILQGLSLELEGVAPHLTDVAIEFAEYHSNMSPSDQKPSYVALAVASIDWLQTLIQETSRTSDISSLEKAYGCIARLVHEKYNFQIEAKGVWLWRKAVLATQASADLISATLRSEIDQDQRLALLEHCVLILRSIMIANGLENIENAVRVYNDETEDIAALTDLCSKFVPRVIDASSSDVLRLSLVRSCFEASLVHPLEKSESRIVQPLQDLNKIRRGRAKKIIPSRRERMSYHAFELLVKLTNDPALGETALPWLVLRLAVPIRAYIADQPLRSRRPQPLSELEELLYSFDCIKQLNSMTPASRPRCQELYPLLVKASRVAGDKWCGSQEVLLPLQDVLESFDF